MYAIRSYYVPFLMWRIDLALNRPGNQGVAFRDAVTAWALVRPSFFMRLARCFSTVFSLRQR